MLGRWSTPSCLKVVGGGLGGPCDYCVSLVQRIGFWGFFRLTQDLGPVETGDWGLGLGLDNKIYDIYQISVSSWALRSISLTDKVHLIRDTYVYIQGVPKKMLRCFKLP